MISYEGSQSFKQQNIPPQDSKMNDTSDKYENALNMLKAEEVYSTEREKRHVNYLWHFTFFYPVIESYVTIIGDSSKRY